jgi:hypothetical protein
MAALQCIEFQAVTYYERFCCVKDKRAGSLSGQRSAAGLETEIDNGVPFTQECPYSSLDDLVLKCGQPRVLWWRNLSWGVGMRRLAFLVLLGLSVAVVAAEIAPTRAYGFGGFLESSLGSVILTPSFKVGYQAMGLHINVPIPQGSTPGKLLLFGIDGLDATLKSSRMWVASGRVAAQVGDWYFFVAASATVPRKVTARFDQYPMLFSSGTNASLDMTDSRVSGWMVEGGTGFEVFDKIILFTGLRRDQVAATLSNPKFEGSNPILLDPAVELDADLLARLWIPYLGINVSGSQFSGSLAYSPFGFSQLKLPWKRVDQGNSVGETALYSFQTPGLFLESKFDYEVRLGRVFDLGVWVKGTWLSFRGEGEEHLKQSVGAPASVAQTSSGGTSSINRYEMSFGLTAAMAF